MAKILETNNYSKFELSPFNSDVRKTGWLRESLLTWGWIASKPLDVRRRADGKLEIRDGQHRFMLAVELGIMVKSVECNDGATAFDFNKAERSWDLHDYLTARLRENKNPAYAAVAKYREETGINLSMTISLSGGYSTTTGKLSSKFKNGTFTLGDQSMANLVGDIVIHCRSLNILFASNNLFVQVLSKILWVEELNPKILKDRISKNVELMKKQVSQKDYINLLGEVYNRASEKRLPLAFLAEEAARKRNEVVGAKASRKNTPRQPCRGNPCPKRLDAVANR